MPQTGTSDSLKLHNVQIDDLLTMGDAAPIDIAEQAAPSTPGANKVRLYAKSDGRLYLKDDTGTEVALDAQTGGAVLESLFDANTILKADSDDTPAALTVGEGRIVGRKTGGSVAALDAAEVLEILAGAISPRPRASMWYDGLMAGGGGKQVTIGAGFSVTADRLYAIPFFCPWRTAWEAIGVNVHTAESGKNIKLGVYAMNSSGQPAARLHVSGALSVGATGEVAETGISLTLPAGWCFVAMRTEATSLKLQKIYRDHSNRYLGRAVAAAHATTYLYTDDGSYAADAIPDPFPAGLTDSIDDQTPRIALKTSATP